MPGDPPIPMPGAAPSGRSAPAPLSAATVEDAIAAFRGHNTWAKVSYGISLAMTLAGIVQEVAHPGSHAVLVAGIVWGALAKAQALIASGQLQKVLSS